MKKKKLRIVVFGIRQLPPGDGCGGAETFAEELYPLLISRGHSVTAYCRRYFGEKKEYPKKYKNIKLIYLPTVKKVGFDTFIHSFFCTIHIIIYGTGDVIHIHNAGNSIYVPLLRLFKKNCYISMAGLDWKVKRWRPYARAYLKITNYLALIISNRVIADNKMVKEYYRNKFDKTVEFIPYGAKITKIFTKTYLDKINIEANKYILYIGRFSQEKGVHYIINAFEKVKTEYKLVLVGDDIFDKKWVNRLRSTKDPRIIFTGFVFGNESDELIQNCYFYINASDKEGLSPGIIRVMGMEKCVLSSDIPQNRVLVENNGFMFKKSNVISLKEKIEFLLDNPDEIKSSEKRCLEFVKINYSWEKVADDHEKIFMKQYGLE